MRPMQERAWAKRGEQYLLIKSPSASGKSRALMFIALDKVHNQGLRQALIVAAHRELIHKIGITNARVEARIADARHQPTFLMADVEVIASYTLYNINRSKLESLLHRLFAPARLAIEIMDRFGNPVVPREWFLVPLGAIDEAVEKIREGTIPRYAYDARTASLTLRP